MWARSEAGLILIEQNRAEAALEHTSHAVSLISKANQAWIRSEQVHLAHARALRMRGELAAAEEQKRYARALHEDKAARIPDLAQRRQFRVAFEKELTRM